MRALDYPAIPAEPLLTFHATAGDAGRDAALPQVTTAACKVIAFVSMQLASDVCEAVRSGPVPQEWHQVCAPMPSNRAGWLPCA